MKTLVLIFALIASNTFASSFRMRSDWEVKSTSLIDMRSMAHEVQKSSPADDDLIYKFNGIYKVRVSRGQKPRTFLRKFLRYNSEWRAEKVSLRRAEGISRSEIFEGLFSEGEEPSDRVLGKAERLVSKIASILNNNTDLGLYYYSSQRDEVYHTDGWLIYNFETRELLAVDISINYEF